MNRRLEKTSQSKITPEFVITEPVQEMAEISSAMVTEHKIDQECQVNFYSESEVNSQTFICNRFIKNETCHAETQTEILEENTRSKKINIINNKKVDKGCGTPQKDFEDQQTQVDNKTFSGFVSIKKDKEMIDLAGVTFENFEFLLKRMSMPQKYLVSKKDRLLIFLMKMKTGLTFAALGVLFSVHRTTISRIFFETLQHLAGATRNLVFWPDIDAVQETMPDCFRPDYSNTRVIIDCTEFRIEIPSSVDNRVFSYSQYKKKLYC